MGKEGSPAGLVPPRPSAVQEPVKVSLLFVPDLPCEGERGFSGGSAAQAERGGGSGGAQQAGGSAAGLGSSPVMNTYRWSS